MAVSFQLVERASQSFTSADVKSVKSVFCRDMCVAENTLRGASVELSAYSGQLRRRAQRILLEKVALPLFRRYQKRQPFGCLFFASILAFLLRLMPVSYTHLASVTLYGENSAALGAYIVQELGIAEENQLWIEPK